MEILTYPVGLLIGLLPVVLDLGDRPEPAHLLLDGRPVCAVTVRASTCTVDLGPDPLIHRLELIRTDQAGRMTERLSRWINKPGVEAEVRANGRCQESTRRCDFAIAWAHPGKLDPSSLTLSLDGQAVSNAVTPVVSLGFPHAQPPQILSVEAAFPDGRRATVTQLLRGSFSETAEAALQAVPIDVDPDIPAAQIGDILKQAEWSIEAIEQKDFEVVFVVEPRALDLLPNLVASAVGRVTLYAGPLADAAHIRVLIPDEVITSFDALSGPQDDLALQGAHRPVSTVSWLRRLILAPRNVGLVRRVRTADAVAVAGQALGGSPRRRIIVLIVGGGEEDRSSYSPAQAQAYLSETLVPLVVWRIGNDAVPGWPQGRVVRSPADFAAGVAQVRRALDRQHVTWIRGSLNPHTFRPELPRGIRIAGRRGADLDNSRVAIKPKQTEAKAIGPDGGTVYALAADAGDIVFAGTNGGVFRSEDGGRHWMSASEGLGDRRVRELAVHRGRPGRLYAGTESGLFVSSDGAKSWRSPELPGKRVTAIGIDSSAPETLYVGTAGEGLWRSVDDAKTWEPALPGLTIEAVFVEPGSQTVLAAVGGRILRRDERGQWPACAAPAGRVVAFFGGRTRGEALYAATDTDGLLRSDDLGKTWRSAALRSTPITDLVGTARRPSWLYAAGLDGVFSSTDGAVSWKLARIGAVLGLAITGGDDPSLLAGTARGVLRLEAGTERWSESNDGLTASQVYAVALDPKAPSVIRAGTLRGLQRTANDGAHWLAMNPGSSEITIYALAIAKPSQTLFGGSGALGVGTEEDDSWTLFPTHGAYAFAADPFDPSILMAATAEGVVRTTDGGLSWRSTARGFSKTIPVALAADPKHQGVFYAGTTDSGIFQTTDSGRQWKRGGRELQRAIVRCLAVDPADADVIYAGTDGGIFVSTNGTRAWSFHKLGGLSVHSIAIDPTDGGTVYAGTTQGLFQSKDAGKTWTRTPGAPVQATVTAIALDGAQRRLVLGTLGTGVQILPLSQSKPN
ncbi:MAG: WD40/YVTN/BNR-like repeat-containing protein [Thermoanaerobaculia bacterium]